MLISSAEKRKSSRGIENLMNRGDKFSNFSEILKAIILIVLLFYINYGIIILRIKLDVFNAKVYIFSVNTLALSTCFYHYYIISCKYLVHKQLVTYLGNSSTVERGNIQ